MSRAPLSTLPFLEALILVFLLFSSPRLLELLTLLLRLLSSPVASLPLLLSSLIVATLSSFAHRGLLDGTVLDLGASTVLVLSLLL